MPDLSFDILSVSLNLSLSPALPTVAPFFLPLFLPSPCTPPFHRRLERVPRSQLEMEDGCGGSGEERRGEEGCAARGKYGGNWTAENYKLLLSCFHWDTKTCFPNAPPFFPHFKKRYSRCYQHVLTQPAWWLQAQSSSAILFFLHLSELIRMKMNSN